MGFLFPDTALKEEIERLKRKNANLEYRISELNTKHFVEIQRLTTELSDRMDSCLESHVFERDLRHLRREHEMIRGCLERSYRQVNQLSTENKELEVRISELRESLRICCQKNKKEKD